MAKRIAVFALSAIPSAIWFFYAICITKCASDAQRGGALGTIFAFGFVIITRSYAMEIFAKDRLRARKEALLKFRASGSSAPLPPPTPTELAQDMDGLLDAIATDSIDQKNLNLCLVIASAFAAFIWGFGDKIAAPFITGPIPPCCH